MARIWCVSAPLYSHTDWGGFLRTARVLSARGHDVTWVSGESLHGAIAGSGLNFAAVAETGWLWPPPPAPDLTAIPPQEAVRLRYQRALDTWLDEAKVDAGIRSLLELAEVQGAPDIILTDPFLSASAVAAEVLGVPMIVCGWPAMRELQEDSLFWVQKTLASESRERIERLSATFGAAGVNFSRGAAPSVQSPYAQIVYFTPGWYQAEADALLPENRFVGGIPAAASAPDWLAQLANDTPLAVVTLGTVFTGDLGFYAWGAQVAAREGLLPIVAVGNNPIAPDKKAELVRALPRGTRLVNFVPFDAVLPRARLMIHHGGMGTTHSAVMWGVPQIIVPHAADQRGQARRAAQAKIGLNLSAHDVRNGKLWEGARAILRDTQVIENCRALAAEMAALGGAEAGADVVERVISGS